MRSSTRAEKRNAPRELTRLYTFWANLFSPSSWSWQSSSTWSLIKVSTRGPRGPKNSTTAGRDKYQLWAEDLLHIITSVNIPTSCGKQTETKETAVHLRSSVCPKVLITSKKFLHRIVLSVFSTAGALVVITVFWVSPTQITHHPSFCSEVRSPKKSNTAILYKGLIAFLLQSVFLYSVSNGSSGSNIA